MEAEQTIKPYVLGLDLGGTNAVFGIIDAHGIIKATTAIKTQECASAEDFVKNATEALQIIIDQVGGIGKIKGMGIGAPNGNFYSGTIERAANIAWAKGIVPLADMFSQSLGIPVALTNDANAAALGEAKFGAGKDYRDSILITLGTGVGGGIIIDGKLFEGFKSAGAEMGHMVIVEGGEGCTCGRQGCFEAYSSATALMKKTREVMQNNPESAMWRGYNLETVSGKTPFDYPEDKAANEIIDWYVKYLACGICNLANIFRPQVVMLGGGVSEQGERLTKPLQARVDAQIFGGTKFAPVKVVKATLGSRAGAFGAATLAFSLRSQTASKN